MTAYTMTLNVPDGWSATAHGFTLNADRLTEMLATRAGAGVLYLLANGFTQSLTDAAAFSKADKDGKTAMEVMDMAADRRARRFNAIMSGEVGSSGPRGPRMTGLEAMARDVAIERLRAAFGAKKRPWPDGKGSAAIIADLVAQILASRHGADILAEAERRMGATPDVGDLLDAI